MLGLASLVAVGAAVHLRWSTREHVEAQRVFREQSLAPAIERQRINHDTERNRLEREADALPGSIPKLPPVDAVEVLQLEQHDRDLMVRGARLEQRRIVADAVAAILVMFLIVCGLVGFRDGNKTRAAVSSGDRAEG